MPKVSYEDAKLIYSLSRQGFDAQFIQETYFNRLTHRTVQNIKKGRTHMEHLHRFISELEAENSKD